MGHARPKEKVRLAFINQIIFAPSRCCIILLTAFNTQIVRSDNVREHNTNRQIMFEKESMNQDVRKKTWTNYTVQWPEHHLKSAYLKRSRSQHRTTEQQSHTLHNIWRSIHSERSLSNRKRFIQDITRWASQLTRIILQNHTTDQQATLRTIFDNQNIQQWVIHNIMLQVQRIPERKNLYQNLDPSTNHREIGFHDITSLTNKEIPEASFDHRIMRSPSWDYALQVWGHHLTNKSAQDRSFAKSCHKQKVQCSGPLL